MTAKAQVAREKSDNAAVGNRRDVLKWAGAAAGALLPGAQMPAQAASPSPGAEAGGLYRESAHVKRYYELARL